MTSSSRRKFLKTLSMAGLLTPVIGTATTYGPAPKEIEKYQIGFSTDNEYLSAVKSELMKEWPKNRTINLVFHGHSVPSGYFVTPDVRPLQSYPFLLLKDLKKIYPNAVINIILTCIGGENSAQGAKRFNQQVLNHRPDVLFIDYALNDTGIGLSASRKAWTTMIEAARKKKIPVVLLTATPDQRVDILDKNTDLQKICDQISDLSVELKTALVNSYSLFQQLAVSGGIISDYMSQVNHPNEKGHQVVTNAIMNFFR
jgi:acyl-CoA thioesterase I